MSQSGANNRPAGEVQSEVELAPAAAYSLGLDRSITTQSTRFQEADAFI